MLAPGERGLVDDVADEAEPRLIEELERALARPLDDGWVQGVLDVLDPALREMHLIGQAIGTAEAMGVRSRVVKEDGFFTNFLLAGRDAFMSFLRRNGMDLPDTVVAALHQRREFASNYIAGRIGQALEPVLSEEARAVLTGRIQQDPMPDSPSFRELRGALGSSGSQANAAAALNARVAQAMRGLTQVQRRALRNQMEQEARDIVADRLEELQEGLSPSAVEDRLQRIVERAADRSDRMRRWRAERIARTEVMRALNSGLEDSWKQLAEEGEIDGDRVVKRWQITYDERTCRTCRPMDGKQRRLGSQFGPLRGGGFVMGPPAHPNCRCRLELEYAEIGQVRKAEA